MTDESTDPDAGGTREGAGGADTPADPEAARERVVEAMGRAAELYGLPRSSGRVYGVLFFADEPLSLDEVADRAGYAKSTASTVTSTLEQLHLVRRRSLPDEGKKAFYGAERNLWRATQRLLDQEVRRELAIVGDALDDAEDALAAADGERAARDLERVRQLQSLYDQADRVVRVLTSTPVDRLADLLGRNGNG